MQKQRQVLRLAKLIKKLFKQKTGFVTISDDEDITKIIPKKAGKFESAFEENYIVRYADISNLNDGAAAVIFVSKEALELHNLAPSQVLYRNANL